MKVIIKLTCGDVFELDLLEILSIEFADINEDVKSVVKSLNADAPTNVVLDAPLTPTVSDGTDCVEIPAESKEPVKDVIDEMIEVLEEKKQEPEPVPVELPSEPITQTVAEESIPTIINSITSETIKTAEPVDAGAVLEEVTPKQEPKVYTITNPTTKAVESVIYQIDEKRQLKVQVEEILPDPQPATVNEV